MKEKEWVNDDRMLFESGFRTFDRQTSIITTGNVIADTEFGWYIRPYNQTKNAIGQYVKPGQLQALDLSYFPYLPHDLKRYIQSQFTDTAGWLYEFFHWVGERKVTDGYIVTTDDHRLLKMVPTGPTYKSHMALKEAAKYITEDYNE